MEPPPRKSGATAAEPFDPVADIFEPASSDPAAEVTLIVENAGPRYWVLHRSDGRCGGIFIDRRSALQEARQEAAMLADALIVIADAGGDVVKERFRAGRPTAEGSDCGFGAARRTLAQAA